MNELRAPQDVEDPVENAPSSPLRVALGFFIVPLLLVVGGVAVFVLFGLIAHEDKSVAEYLSEVTGGGINEPWQGAFGLANKLQRDDTLHGDAATAERIADTLEHRNAADPQVRRFLLLALGRVGHGSSVPVVAEHLDDPEADVRLNALWSLGSIGAPEASAAAPRVAERLVDEDLGVRTYAAYVLGTLDNEAAVEPLQVALNDTAAQVRWNAAVSLALLDDDAGIDELRRMIDRDEITARDDLSDQQVQDAMIAAIQGLANLRARGVTAELRDLRDHDPDLRVREAAREALASMQ